MPRFELGTKFWSVERRARNIDVRWGEIGTPGRTVLLRDQDAKKFAALIATKRAEGYVEVDATAPARPAMTRWTRRFEGGARMLEITLDGRRVYQRHADNQPAEYVTHPTADDARDIAERIAKSALANGLSLVRQTSPDAATGPLAAATNPELATLCRGSPDDPMPWAVYADWLISRGDIRGELAALINGGEPSAFERILELRPSLFGGQIDVADATELVGYRFGFPSVVEINRGSTHAPLHELVAGLLALPLVELLDTLRVHELGHWGDTDWAAAVDAIACSSHANTLHELDLGRCSRAAGSLLHGLHALTTLRITGSPGDHPGLRVLVMSVLARDDVAVLGTVALPALERLELQCHSPMMVGSLFERLELPALRQLAIATPVHEPLIAALARSSLLPQLRALDLSSHPLDASAGRRLADDAAAFRHLERLELGPYRGTRITRALPNARVVER